MYGGAAGGGKSDALLDCAVQYVEYPEYAALVLRRTYKDLSLPGALMDRSKEWWMRTDAIWHEGSKTWRFPSGATITFGYLDSEKDVYQYQGAEFQTICFDELTQFSEFQYRYMMSRLRRLKGSKVPIRCRSGSNPGGFGHEWVKARFVAQDPYKTGRIFIPATLDDNPSIDREAYIQSLNELDPITRAQLLNGDWEARQEGLIAQRAWFPVIEKDQVPAIEGVVRFWDLAATEKSQGNERINDPDYTVGTLMGKAKGTYYILHVIRGRFKPNDVEELLLRTAEMDGINTPVRWEQEPGSAGKLYGNTLIRKLAGFNVSMVSSSGDKVTRAMPFIAQAQAGNVKLIRGDWNIPWIDEITAMPVVRHDDQWDSCSGAFGILARPKVRLS